MTKHLAVGVALMLAVAFDSSQVVRTQGQNTNAASPPARNGSVGRIVRLDPALDAIVPPEATIELVHRGEGGVTEGPVWTRDGALLFSDMAANVITRLTPDGQARVFRKEAGSRRRCSPGCELGV